MVRIKSQIKRLQIFRIFIVFERYILAILMASSHFSILKYKYNLLISFILGSDSDTDLASSVTEFFSSLQMLSTDAASEPLRNVVVNKSQALVNRFKSVEQQFNAMERQLNGNIGMI